MEVTVSAKTVEEAVALGASQLGKLVSEVKYEVLEEGKKGILGLGSREATVKVTAVETVQDKVLEYINRLITDMGAEAVAKVARIEENLADNGTVEKDICINIEGKGLGCSSADTATFSILSSISAISSSDVSPRIPTDMNM